MTRLLRPLLAAAALAVACATPAPQAGAAPAPGAVPLRISPEQVLAPVNHEVLSGFNFGNWMQVADFADDLRAVRPTGLRYPAGEFGDSNDLTEASLSAFQANLSLLGNPAAVIQTRVGSRSMSGPAHNRPEDAADAVRWAKARGIQVRYWEIGNEPDLFPLKQSDPVWADFTAEKYCQVFRAQAAAIKAVDPAARVAGPGVSGARPARDRYLERFVAACGDAVDVLTWHVYPSEGTLEDDAAFATVAEIDGSITAVRALWADPARNPTGHQRKVELAVTEYGLSSMTTRMHHLADLPAALWTLEAALRLDEHGVSSAQYFAFQGSGGHGLLDQGGGRRPTFYVFQLLAGLSGNLVAASTPDADLWTHAARDGGRLDVVVTNRATRPKLLATAVPGFALRTGNYFDEAVTREEKPVAAVAIGAAVTLPPRSVVHLVYEKR